MPSKKKKYNARFPPARIKKIMQTDEDVGKVAAAVPVIISRALELFVESLLTKAVQVTTARNAKTLSPNHLKLCILAEGRFDFLKDLVMSIPDVQVEGEEVGGVGMLPTPTATHSPQVFRSQSHSEEGAGTLMPPSSSRGRRPRGRPRKNPLAAPRAPTTKNAKSTTDSDETESAESDASDEDEDLSTDTDSATRGSKHPVAGKSGREGVPSPQSQLQFNAVQPNFYQEINSTSAPFQIRINLPAQDHESKVAVNGQSKVPDAAVDDDYDT